MAWIWQFALAVGFGVGSAVIPVLNAEVYVLGMGVSGEPDPLIAAIGVSIGQTIGKGALFLTVRLRPARAARSKKTKPVNLDSRGGRLIHRHQNVSKRLLNALSERRYGIPVTLLSSSVGIPPLYGVSLLAGASKLGLPAFASSVLVGRLLRFTTIALGLDLLRG